METVFWWVLSWVTWALNGLLWWVVGNATNFLGMLLFTIMLPIWIVFLIRHRGPLSGTRAMALWLWWLGRNAVAFARGLPGTGSTRTEYRDRVVYRTRFMRGIILGILLDRIVVHWAVIQPHVALLYEQVQAWISTL